MSAFSPEDITVLANAYERAWRELSGSAAFGGANTLPCRRFLARSIINEAEQGVLNEGVLARHALEHLRRRFLPPQAA